ncbi:hypothetical protein G4B88_025263 [Cannabis sativa]|uniref:Uncharacterized protein n=1 Tax=Cannabis sativa TaxID=3483 RepID=A0A7J6HSB1_CANSA|nr:hypothetical protein G4B88_025263 [Cannabis sativa]
MYLAIEPQNVKLADLIGCDIDLTGGTKSKNISTCRDPLCSCLARASTSFPIALRLCLDLLHAKSEVCKPMEIPLGLIPRLMTKGESAWRKVKIEGSRAKFPSGVFRRQRKRDPILQLEERPVGSPNPDLALHVLQVRRDPVPNYRLLPELRYRSRARNGR